MDEQSLLLDEEVYPILIEGECKRLQPLMRAFVDSYKRHKDIPVDEWLRNKLQENMPEKSSEEIQMMSEEIICTVKCAENNKMSLADAISNGRSKEDWFASQLQKSMSAMSVDETVKYLTNLDVAMENANEALYRTITTQAGNISKNPCLDGFIAEQYHVQTFNLNAEARGSEYRARVLEPAGQRYAKNSVDIVVENKNGKVVSRYQSKYCKDAKATQKAFERGDYRGQQKLVPEEQQNAIVKKSTTVIEAPDGTTSTPLSKSSAKKLRDEAQSGNWNELNWNEYKTKDLAKGIGKQAGYAAIQGAAIGVGFDVAQKLWNGEEIEGEEIVETALASGADFGIKAATAGALKVGVEKEVITVIPKGTPASTIANIAHVAIEDAKVFGKIAMGELSAKEGLEKIEQTTVSTTAGLVSMEKGAKIGSAIATIFGPVGAAVGGFVGGTVGYMAGSKIGEKVVKGAQKLREGAKKIGEKAEEKVTAIVGFFRGVVSLFGR